MTEQRVMFIEVLADKFQWASLNDKGLDLDKGWRVVSVTIAGSGQSNYRSYGVVVLLERPVKPVEAVQS